MVSCHAQGRGQNNLEGIAIVASFSSMSSDDQPAYSQSQSEIVEGVSKLLPSPVCHPLIPSPVAFVSISPFSWSTAQEQMLQWTLSAAFGHSPLGPIFFVTSNYSFLHLPRGI